MTVKTLKSSAATALVSTVLAPSVALAQDVPFDLGTLVLEGERSDRPLEEAPAAIAVVTGEEAEKPQNLSIRNVLTQVPNVLAEDGIGLPAIRGVDGSGFFGGTAFTSGAQPRINIFVDGVPRQTGVNGGGSAFQSTWDTGQVEVARGPQSTLGGRNSLGGAIRIQTNDPVHFREGAFRFYGFDEDGTLGTSLMLNTPIVQDQIALRFTAEASEGERFVDVVDPRFAPFEDEFNDEETRRYRAKLLVEPDAVPGLRIVATAEHTNTLSAFADIADDDSRDTITNIANITSNTDSQQDVFSIQANYAFSDQVEAEIRLSRIENDLNFLPFFDPASGTRRFDIEQEFDSSIVDALVRFENIGRLNRGVIGFTYERQDESIAAEPDFPVGATGSIESLGIYGEADIALSDRLDFIIGGRYEDDQRERDLTSFAGTGNLDLDESTFIPKIGLRYQLTDEVNIGYQYTEGFRPGGLDFDIFDPDGTNTVFSSERLRQHEIYTRGTYLDGRATLNASLFYYEFEDAQIEGAGALIASGPSAGFRLIGNVPEAEGFGGEIEGSYDFGNGFFLDGGLGLLSTEVTDAGVVPEFQGSDLPRAPSVTAVVGLSYEADNWDASVRVRHVGSQIRFLGADKSASYTTLDLAAGYDFELANGNTFRVEGFVNNVANEIIDLGNFVSDETRTVGRPRTVGIAGTIRF
ncbi:MAG: TonB-dependent receptor [Pseudomonadota bacterium]